MINEERQSPGQATELDLWQAQCGQDSSDQPAIGSSPASGMVDLKLSPEEDLRQRLRKSRTGCHYSTRVQGSYPVLKAPTDSNKIPPAAVTPMSRLQALIQSFSQTLPPGTTLVLLAAELPGGRTLVSTGDSLDSIAEPERSTRPLPSEQPMASTTSEPPLEHVAGLRAKHGTDAPLKLREWHEEVAISIRELRRAVKHGAVEAGRKPDGRDNKALTITIGAMEAYMRTVDAVERGLMDRPTWWTEVRGGGRSAA